MIFKQYGINIGIILVLVLKKNYNIYYYSKKYSKKKINE